MTKMCLSANPTSIFLLYPKALLTAYVACVLVEKLVTAAELKKRHISEPAFVRRLHLKLDLHERVGRFVEVGVGEAPADSVQIRARRNVRLTREANEAGALVGVHLAVQLQNGQIVLECALVKVRILDRRKGKTPGEDSSVYFGCHKSSLTSSNFTKWAIFNRRQRLQSSRHLD